MAQKIQQWTTAVILVVVLVGAIIGTAWLLRSYKATDPAREQEVASQDALTKSMTEENESLRQEVEDLYATAIAVPTATETPDAQLQAALARITQEALDTIVARAPDLPTATPVPPVDRAKQAASQQELAAAQTQAERVPSVSSDGIDVGNGVLVAGPPASVVPTKFGNGEANSSSCSIPGACWILKDPGVISADEPDDCGDNASCIVINPLTQVPLVHKTTELLCSEGGYLQLSAATMTVSGDGWSFTLPRKESNGHLAEVRCPNGAPHDGVDSNLIVQVTIGEPGAGSAIRYPVPTEAGAFRSEAQTLEEVMSTHSSENCGGASDGCSTVGLFLFDTNDGAYTALSHTVEGGWTLEASNVQ